MGDWQRLLAPAKLTLSLHIVGVRPDGCHLVDAEMVTLDLADELLVRSAMLTKLSVKAHTKGMDVPTTDDNLVLTALRLVDRTAEVRLTKHIPSGAGLGGGSADAAAILRWAGYDDPLGAVHLGADVAFCLRGGRARVTGIGELVDLLPYQPLSFTLITPPFGVSTALVYQAWDELGAPQHPDNDLTSAAIDVEPRLARWRDEFADATQRRPVLAGSGVTWFVPGVHYGVRVGGVDATIVVAAAESGTES